MPKNPVEDQLCSIAARRHDDSGCIFTDRALAREKATPLYWQWMKVFPTLVELKPCFSRSIMLVYEIPVAELKLPQALQANGIRA